MSDPATVSSAAPSRPSKSPIAERVRAARLAAGLSQFRLAARAGVSLQTVSLVERAGLITEATAEKLAIVLGCDARELLP